MNNNLNKSFIEILTIYKECWDTYNISKLKPFLDEKIEIHVQWYSKPIVGKKDCLDYLKYYFDEIKELTDFDFKAHINFFENEQKEPIPYIIERMEDQMSSYEKYFYLEIEGHKIMKINVE